MNDEIKRNDYRALIPINKCDLCEITDKETDPSFIEVDHQDRDHSNNEISNLWALCKLCHNIKSFYENKRRAKYWWLVYLSIKKSSRIKKAINSHSLELFNGKKNPPYKDLFVFNNPRMKKLEKENKEFIEEKMDKYYKAKNKNLTKKERIGSNKATSTVVTKDEYMKTQLKRAGHEVYKKKVHEEIMEGLRKLNNDK